MFTKHLAAALLIGSALIALPAAAQDAPKASSSTAQNASSAGQWQGSKLIHMNVYNNDNEKIGDIKELMLDKSGKVDNVVIGVGGFLGMGEHDVAVKFTDLKWVDEPARSASSSSSSSTGSSSANTTGTGSSANSSMTRSSSKQNYPDHAVLNATKDQLKAMPQFDYNK